MKRVPLSGRAHAGGVLALLASLAMVELMLRLLATGSSVETHLLGRRLPPVDPLLDLQLRPTRFDESAGFEVGGVELTRGDLWGISREHPVLGHAPVASAVSVNGWWQSNSHGARSRREIPEAMSPGVDRWLAFGDSYTHGSRVHQEQTWPALLDSERPDLEVVNFGVDGYGMAQSLLRYRDKRDALRHSGVVLVFVPGADLVRDVNVFRPLLGWRSPITAPRFEVESRCSRPADGGGPARLVPALYSSLAAFVAANADGMSTELREHLRCHDALYRRVRHEALPLVGSLHVSRLVLASIDAWRERRFRDDLTRPDGEALRVSRAIFRELADDLERRRARFLLVFLPLDTEVAGSRGEPAFLLRWQGILESSCPQGTACLDLLPALAALPPGELDRGLGSHYGPRANRAIARLIGTAIDDLIASESVRTSARNGT